MRVFTLILLTSFLFACSSAPSIRYYQLDGGEFAPNKLDKQTAANVIVSSPKLIGHLANRGIAVEVAPLQIQSANNHLWSSSPSELMLQAAVVNLDRQLPNMRVIPLQLESAINASLPTYRVDFYINKFQADLNGNGIVAGNVTIYKLDHTIADIVFSQGFSEQVALQDDGYAPLVNSLNNAWLSVNNQIAKELKALVYSN